MKSNISIQRTTAPIPSPKLKTQRYKRAKVNVQAWLLLLPSLIFLGIFTIYPIIKTIYLSFFHLNLAHHTPEFAGFSNYSELFSNKVFHKVLLNTFLFAIGTVPTSMALGLGMAIFVNKAIKAKGWVRTLFFYPVVIPMIAVANFWLFIYTPNYGLLDKFLHLFGAGAHNWLGDPGKVLPAMMFMMMWKQAGFLMVFYLAGLQNISTELYEAADIDGANAWHKFRKITFPLLMPTTLFVFIISLTNSFKIVDHIVIMTQGGPDNASNLLLYYIYETAFQFLDKGMAATLTVILIVILFVLSVINFISTDRRIHYS